MHKTVVISSFSHKGGVGKTTGIHNIACVLAKEFGMRVLLVDADPQCNLTSVLMHSQFRALGKSSASEALEEDFVPMEFVEPTANVLTLSEKERRKIQKLKKKVEMERKKEQALAELEQGEEIFYPSLPEEVMDKQTEKAYRKQKEAQFPV